ncbi:MAG: tetratricopeptide repeat protein [Candidatus Omnitrophica bacterium]|nr:tetratricopeptide repeat protein [Candidatus Omnitrophota bacterium]
MVMFQHVDGSRRNSISKHWIAILTASMLCLGITVAFSDDERDPVITVTEKVDDERIVHVFSVSEAYEYALSLEKQDLYLRAVPFYQGIIAIQPDNSDAHARLGYIFYMSKEYNKAQEEFEWKLTRDPNDVQANLLLGFTYQYGKKDPLSALKYYEQAIKNSEGDEKVAALEFAGDIYQLVLRDWDKAIEYYRLILHIQPNNVKTHFNLGACLANAGNFEEAIAQFQEVINTAQNSNHPELFEKAQQAIVAVESAQKSK